MSCGISAARAHEAARPGTGLFAILEDRGPGDEGRAVAVDPLHEAAAAGRQIVDDLGLVEAQPVKIDNVEVGAQAGLQPSPIMEAKEIGGLAGLHLDELRQLQAGAAFAVARPVAEHVARQTGIDDLAAMRAAIAQAEQRARIDQQRADLLVVAMDITDDREEEEMVLAFG